MFSKIKNWVKKKLDTIELKKSDYARDFGWHIEYKGEFIGELIDPKWVDMFWYSYKIRSNHEK